MIADDMMTFIKNDIVVFGLGVFLFIISYIVVCFKRYYLGNCATIVVFFQF